MIIVNTETVPGFEITALCGMVQGNTIRAKHVGRDIAASFKNLVGGELRGYTELLTEARRVAVERRSDIRVLHCRLADGPEAPRARVGRDERGRRLETRHVEVADGRDET